MLLALEPGGAGPRGETASDHKDFPVPLSAGDSGGKINCAQMMGRIKP